jgi:hypothetical protein
MAKLESLSMEELTLLDVALIRLADSDEKYWNNSKLWHLYGEVFNAVEKLEGQRFQ